MIKKRLLFKLGLLLSVVGILFNTGVGLAHYDPNYLVSDAVFNTSQSMSVGEIQNFLNSKNSGLKNLMAVETCDPVRQPYWGSYFTHCNNNVSAAQIIYDAAQAYTVNPRVILATLQKEQSLITTPNPTSSQINCAMGYNSCDGFASFFSQIDNGTWALRTYIELMSGRDWWGYTPASYPCKNASSLYSTGLYPGRTVTFYNPGGQARTVNIHNAATAALYCYTPHVGPYSETGYSGSYNFVINFENWFGSTITGGYFPCQNGSNADGVPSGAQVIANKYGAGQADRLSLTFVNNTGSKCAEVHTWAYGYQSWINNIATNLYPLNPADGQIISGNTYDDGRDELMLAKTANTGGGWVEIHTWAAGYQNWLTNIVTNLHTSVASNGKVIAADTNGDGRDELMFVMYTNTGSGNVEIHTWNHGAQSWNTNIATNLTSADSANGTIIAAQVNGRDRLMFVKSANTAGGKVEVHTWNPGYQNWSSNVVTNLDAADLRANGKVLGVDDKLAFVKYSNTGGKVEVHTWNPGYQSWLNNIATNQSSW